MAKKPFQRSRAQMKEAKEYDEEVIQIDRVTRVVKGGRRLRFRATVVIGNRKGKVGIGIGKSNEVMGAIQKAVKKAKKNILNVPIVKETIPHDIKVKFKSARVILLPAGPGTGIIAGGAVRKIVELAGIKNILSKAVGTTNRVTNTRATFEALRRLRTVFVEKPEEPKKKEKKEKQEEKVEIKKIKPQKKEPKAQEEIKPETKEETKVETKEEKPEPETVKKPNKPNPE